MPRLIATYRWELWLLLGIPVIAQTARILMFILVDGVFRFSNSNAAFSVVEIGVAASVLLLLTLSYPRIRGLGREFLAILWAHRIAAAVLGAAIQSAALLLNLAYPEGVSLGSQLLLYLAAAPFQIGVLLWFARRASRISLPHAFFLIALTSFVAPPASRGSPDAAIALAFSMAVGAVIALTLALAKVWLLGNFDRRDAAFRRNAIAALIAAALLSGWARSIVPLLLSGEGGEALQAHVPFAGLITGGIAFAYQAVTGLALLFVYFALVYFVRERRPVAAGAMEG